MGRRAPLDVAQTAAHAALTCPRHPGCMIAAASLASFAAASAPKLAAASGAAEQQPAAEQKRTEAQKAKLQNVQDGLATLKSIGQSSNATAAGIAAQKLEALKQRLKMLMMLGGDPRQIAKEAAEIAKQIGQAAKDYAQAAGGSSSAAAPQPAQAPAANADAPVDADTAAAPVAAGVADGIRPAGADPATAHPAAPFEAATVAGPAADHARTNLGSMKTATAPAGGSHASGPDPVLEEAKQLAAQAKAILKAAIAKAKQQHADPAELAADEAKMSDAEKAIRDAEKTMGSDGGSSSYSGDGQAVAAPAVTPAPTVSVQV